MWNIWITLIEIIWGSRLESSHAGYNRKRCYFKDSMSQTTVVDESRQILSQGLPKAIQSLVSILFK